MAGASRGGGIPIYGRMAASIEPSTGCPNAIEHSGDHRRRSGSSNGADSDIARVMDPGMHARIGDRSGKQPERKGQ
jgi:hypothetical protein